MGALNREFPDATPEELETKAIAALLGIGPNAGRCRACGKVQRADAPDPCTCIELGEDDRVTLTCPLCDTPFKTTPDLVAMPASKWTRWCPYCLAGEM